MRFTTSAGFLIAAVVARVGAQDTGQLGNAVPVDNNPAGAVIRATLSPNPFLTPDTPAGGAVVGEIVASTPPDGVGAMFKVSFQNLPKEGGPFTYHIHVDPVPADGNCTSTLGHLDPFIRGETPACDASAPETCQVGDLAGKHGKIDVQGGASYQNSFTDDFVAMYEGPGSFFGNRSVVLHFANLTRIACANFEVVNAGVSVSSDCTTSTETASATGSAGGNGTVTTASATKPGEAAPTGTQVTVSAAEKGVGAMSVVGSLVSLAAALFFVL